MQKIVLENMIAYKECLGEMVNFYHLKGSISSLNDDLILELSDDIELPSKEEMINKLKECFYFHKKQELEKVINQICDTKILEGFNSDALGSLHHYDMRLEDQLNINALASANLGSPFRCAKVLEDNTLGPKTYKEHTKAEIRKVFADGLRFKSEILNFYGAEKERLYQIDSLEELQNFEIKEI
ncbi:hypothetical protein [Helicobacter cetorum]|uniref:hypothetical protein n=1 Tax=Helicobacter cetorum TaxID=138563 RepID=UPI001F24EF06|nr:hypothetical protein [Helicobacter cetorum]